VALIDPAGPLAKQQQAPSELLEAPAAAVAATDDAACKKETARQADGDGQNCSAHMPHYCPDHGSSYPTQIQIKGVTRYELGMLPRDSVCASYAA